MTDNQETGAKRKGMAMPLVVFLLPFLLFFPYRWLIYTAGASGGIVSPRLDEDHRQMHLGMFWFLTYFPFSGVCFFSSIIMMARQAHESRFARWGLTVASGCFVIVLGLLVLIFAGC